jgi:hypothetical protein
MHYLSLFTGLILPWACGYICLAAFESLSNQRISANRLCRAGYGFFVGYAILYFIILANSILAENISYLTVMLSLAILVFAGSLLLIQNRRHKSISNHSERLIPAFSQHNRAEKALLVALMLWIAIHLIIAAVELLTTPLYPWDASLLWIYRAKAWFYSENFAAMVSGQDWINSASVALYTVDAYDYPKFASIIPFWAAVSLGSWSESLVNIPVLLCGIAIGLSFYGQIRAIGISTIAATILCYFLFSTPLFGTHIALAGYADMWMAGFAGLGFLALIRGLIEENKMQLAFGLALVAMSMLVKNEGAVWFYSALLLIFIANVRPRISLICLGVISLLFLISFAFGISYIELPLVGGIGIVENRMTIPLIGHFLLEVHNVWDVYLSNFFAFGNWNFLWALIIAGSMAAMFPPFERRKGVALAFLMIFVSTQLFIFAFTQQGLWAMNATAINRLPLQLLPALLFVVAVIGHSFFNQPTDEALHE